MNPLKNKIKRSLLYKLLFNLKTKQRQNDVVAKWRKNGCPLPPPHEYKQQTIIHYASKYRLTHLVESGTFLGLMIDVMRFRFKTIFSIELDTTLFNNARQKFSDSQNIHILQGDSGKVISDILSTLNEPALFWLDGHYSEGITAKGELNTPILNELGLILNHKIKNHVILIDDARCFTGNNDYPTIEQLASFSKSIRHEAILSVENDIIRVYNK